MAASRIYGASGSVFGDDEREDGLLAPGVVVGLLVVESCGFATVLNFCGLDV